MFDELKEAWRDAVRNFRRELEEDDDLDPTAGPESMRRALDAAAAEARRLAGDIALTRRRLDEEREQLAVCRRRESLARGIGDAETADVAARFGARHGERAAILEQKLAALQAEHVLWRRDLDEMEAAVRAREAAQNLRAGGADAAHDGIHDHGRAKRAGTRRGSGSGGGGMGQLDNADPATEAFRELERAARERAAAERLEELKRRRS